MFVHFNFMHFLMNPDDLANKLKSSSFRGFKLQVVLVFLIGVVLFSIREFWGMGTEAMTPLLTTMSTADYTIARFVSLFATVGWSLIYMSFHFFAFAYIISLVANIPYKHVLPLQLLMTSLLLVEKALVFIVFAMQGATASVSFLSLGPLAMTFMENDFLILFFNQLTLTTAVIIILQYKFIATYIEVNNKVKLLWVLIGIHLFLAVLTASVGFIPQEGLFNYLTGGGVGNE
ncbi:hypothetical protein ACXYMX_03790 [Sporosarcina sp. CAU 1771]